jgi:hypothetical protein
MKQITFEISDEAWNLLNKIGNGYAEYRDTRYETLKDFLESDDVTETRNTDWFLNRNFGGTYYLIGELLTYNLVDTDDMSWHPTYVLTPFGKSVIGI